MRVNRIEARGLLLPMVIILGVGLLLTLPFFVRGVPAGHDINFHTFSWMEVEQQWKHGIVYPRWASMAEWGRGEPRFVFYPPFSWTLGAALGAVLPWKFVPGVYAWIALSGGGLAMFALARQWLERRSAIFAAVLYSANPYLIDVAYRRSAYAELLACVLLPVLFLYTYRWGEGEESALPPLAIIVACAWLMNVPAAIMVNYSLTLLLAVFAYRKRSWRILWQGGVGLAVGMMLATFYVLPAAYERRWINIGTILRVGLRPEDNVLFSRGPTPHGTFNLAISLIAVVEILFLAGIFWYLAKNKRLGTDIVAPLLAWVLLSTVLMIPLSMALWRYLPNMRYVQFPWRWLLCLNLPFSLLATMVLRRNTTRAVMCALLFITMILGWRKMDRLKYRYSPEVNAMVAMVSAGPGYPGMQEYVSVGAKLTTGENKDAPLVTSDVASASDVQVTQWTAELKEMTARTTRPTRLTLRLFNYPSWKIAVNDRETVPQTDPSTGQIVIPVPSGESRVTVKFERTWDRVAGGVISSLAFVLLLFLWTRTRRAVRVRREEPLGSLS